MSRIVKKAKAKNQATQRVKGAQKPAVWDLVLYVAGQTPKSVRALANLKAMCDEHLKGRYRIQVVDLLNNAKLARGDQIVAIPTLVRKLPVPIRKIIGDLSNTTGLLVGLDLRAADASAAGVSA